MRRRGARAVVLRIGVADEIEAFLARRRVEQIVDELVGIGAFGPADHAPHGDVPFVAIVPDDLGDLRPRHSAHLDVEAELAPFLRDQLRRLEFLGVAGLGAGDQHKFAHAVAGRVGRSGRQHGQTGDGGDCATPQPVPR